PQLGGEPFVDDDDRLLIVGTRERAASDERHTQRLEIAREGDESFRVALRRTRAERDALRHPDAGERNGEADARLLHARPAPDLVDEPLVELASARPRLIDRAGAESLA